MPTKRLKKKSPTKKRKPIADRIVPVHELETNLVMLVYGRSGTGKTEFGSTWPKPCLFLDINERGTETIRGKKGIDVLEVREFEDLTEVYWLLKKGTKYKSVILDQVSNLQDLGMAKVKADSNKKSSELFTRKNWGELSGLMKQTIDDFRGLSDQYNVCLIAHERTFDLGDEEDESLEPSIGARVMPSVGSFMEGAVDAIGATFIQESHVRGSGKVKKEKVVEYRMRTGPHAFYSTKVRRPVAAGPLPESIKDPTYLSVTKLIAGESVSKTTTSKKRSKKI